MMEAQYISLNMTPTGVNPCFRISQYDVGRTLGFIVHSGGATVGLDTYTCTVEATRSDGTAITSAVATTDNIGTFEVTPTMSNKADKYRCQLVIVDENSKRIASLPFDMEVIKAAMGENSEAIEEDASLYQQYTEAVQATFAEVRSDIQAEENARIAAVAAEATTRANANATLQDNINAEATARQVADNSLQSAINAEASTRATQDASLQSQINQIIAPSGEAPSAAEVENARIGYNGTAYDTLGNAIRNQITDIHGILGTALLVKFATTPETISANNITENIAFYAKTSVVSDLPVSRNGFFLSMRIASTDYRLQVFYDFSGKKIWWRLKGNTWLAWNCVSDDQYYTNLLTSYMQTLSQHSEAVDSISVNSVFYATQSFNSGLPTAGNGMLRTTIQSNGFGLQEFYDYGKEAVSWRLKGENGWLAWHTEYFAKNCYYISGTQKRYLRYEQIEVPTLHQDIAAYNDTLFVCYNYDDNHRIRVIDLSDASYTDYAADNGHGNGLVCGQTVANGSDYPLLYSSGWDDGKIYALKFTGTAFQLVNTINLPVNGYTTCAVDDINHIAYIFYLDEYPTVNKPYTFIAWDYEHETELYRKLTEPFETMQGIDFHNGTITVASGYSTETSLKTYRTYDLFGNKTGEYIGHPSSGEREPEGFTFDPITHRTFMAEVTRLFEIKNI